MKTLVITKRTLFIGISLIATLFFSCQKSADLKPVDQGGVTTSIPGAAYAIDEDAADNTFFTMVMSGENADADASVSATACAIKTVVPAKNVYPQTVTTDFGTGCPDAFGRIRKGKISTTYSGRMTIPGSLSETAFDNYYLDSAKVDGKHVIQNITVTGGPTTFSYLAERTDTYPSGNYRKVVSQKISVQTEGTTTKDKTDDGYNTTGTTNQKQLSSSQVITVTTRITDKNPVHKLNSCQFFDAGIVVASVRVPGKPVISESLNYGNGNCDDAAVLTVNGEKRDITLPALYWATE